MNKKGYSLFYYFVGNENYRVEKDSKRFMIMTEYGIGDIWEYKATHIVKATYPTEADMEIAFENAFKEKPGKDAKTEIFPVAPMPAWFVKESVPIPGLEHYLSYKAAASLLHVTTEMISSIVRECDIPVDKGQDDNDYFPYISMKEIRKIAEVIYIEKTTNYHA